MRMLVIALILAPLFGPESLHASQGDEVARNRQEIRLLYTAATDDLRLIDRKKLSAEDGKTYDDIRNLLQRVRLYLNERTQSGILAGTLSQAQEAASKASELVRKHLKVPEYEQLAAQYREGDQRAVTALSIWLSDDLERVIAYLEASGVRGTRMSSDAFSPAASATTGRVLATCVLLHTQAAFENSDPGPHLRVARRLMALLADGALPDGFRRDWYVSVAGHLQGQLDLAGAVGLIHEALQIFSTDALILVAAGNLYELLATPTTDIPPQRTSKTGNSDLTSMGNTRTAAAQRDLILARENRSWARSRAEEYYRKAIAADASCLEARLRLGRVLHLSGRAEAAMEELRLAAKSDDRRVRYLASLFLGAVHESSGGLAEAEREYRNAVRACPDCLTGAIALSNAIRSGRQPGRASQVLEPALERDKWIPAEDPWWSYPLGSLWQRDRIVRNLLASLQ